MLPLERALFMAAQYSLERALFMAAQYSELNLLKSL
jgi:hypothetical protein